MHRLDWSQGEYGKGLVDQYGGVHTWNEDEYPIHADYLDEYPDIKPDAYFYIEPHGKVDMTYPRPTYDSTAHERMMDTILDTDPNLHPAVQKDLWSFG